MKLKKALRNYLTRFKYAGNAFECPICKFKAKTFLDGGLYKKRKYAKCPNCNSLERHRQLYLILQSNLAKTGHASLLHFAPERCLYQAMSQFKNIDYKTSHYGESQPSDYHYDIRNIDAKDNTYDYIICSHVLEHIDEDRKAMSEICRVLKKDGIAFIQVPIWPSEKHPTYENFSVTDEEDRIIHFGQFDHVRIYGLDVKDRLANAGFRSIEVLDLCKTYDPAIVQKYGLKNHGGVRDLTYVCRKY